MSNRVLTYTFTFALGAAAGSVVAWKLLKNKYEQIAREEIASVKDVFSERLKNEKKEPEETEYEQARQENIDTYREIARDYGEVSDKNDSVRREDKNMDEPYVITPDEYGDKDDYDCVTYTYYADGVLTDEMDEIVDDIDDTVGDDALTRLREYDVDSVYVRNDTTQCDYEILYDSRNYSSVYGR